MQHLMNDVERNPSERSVNTAPIAVVLNESRAHELLRVIAGWLEKSPQYKAKYPELVLAFIANKDDITRPTCGDSLSEREKEIIKHVREAKSNKEIAYDLHLAEGTVKEYIFRLFNKLHIDNRTRMNLARMQFGVLGETGGNGNGNPTQDNGVVPAQTANIPAKEEPAPGNPTKYARPRPRSRPSKPEPAARRTHWNWEIPKPEGLY
jgi:DNA-binding CsgD family transcriptional regulator